MSIQIFLSCPTSINATQTKVRKLICGECERLGFIIRSLGFTDYPTKFPLGEVLKLAKPCSGGLILGFAQFQTSQGIWKSGTPYEQQQQSITAFPTAWNQLEAGILFAIGVPLLIFREENITGGIFDSGVSDLFIQRMPKLNRSRIDRNAFRQVIDKWASEVKAHYDRNNFI